MSRTNEARAGRARGWERPALGSLVICVALAAIPSTAQGQSRGERSEIVYDGPGLCITGWASIEGHGVGHGAPVSLARAQLHTYQSCPATLGEGGGDAGSAPVLKLAGADTLAILVQAYYWDGGQGAWVECAQKGAWQFDHDAWSAAHSEIITGCPRQSYVGVGIEMWARDLSPAAADHDWHGRGVWSGYYWFE